LAQAVHTPVLLFFAAAVGVHLLQPGMPHFFAEVAAAVMVVLVLWWVWRHFLARWGVGFRRVS
jgi:hypothetical protein